ncbi:hypothetical protein KAH81_05435 [bacterium]|nr:hypothetical protein [bacterium]
MKVFLCSIIIVFCVFAVTTPILSPHFEHDSVFGGGWIQGEVPSFRPSMRPHTELSHEIYGFLPYWEYSGYMPSRIDLLTRIAYFNITLNSYGNVSSTHDWPTTTLLDAAHSGGCAVDLCVVVFDESTISSIVGNATNRSNACHNICEQMALGADGVNIDFELPNSSDENGFYAFLRELADSVHARDSEKWVSVCLPSVDWHGTFDSDSLLPHLDALFLMGYGYYWGGSSTTGPVAPLDDPGCYYDIAYSVEHYCGSDAFKRSRFIVGLPLYGYDWPCSGTLRGASTTATGTASIYSSCVSDTLTYGCNWDGNAPCPWYIYSSYRQCWWDDARSLDIKYRWSVTSDLMGIGYWALGYDNNDATFWNGVAEVFAGDFPRDTIIDDVSFGFEMNGDLEFWHEVDTGYFNTMWWISSTSATDPSDDTCFSTWTPNLPDRRNYELFAHIPAVNSVASARYAVNHDFGTDTVIVRQADFFDEWVSLGTYSFEAGAGGTVYLGDATGFADERIGFDALWWSNRGELPAPDTLVTLSSNGFRWQGPISYRRIVPGGVEGTTYWTNSISHTPDVNGGWWRPQLPISSNYSVCIFIPGEHNQAEVSYQIKHVFGVDTVTTDQSLYSDEWVQLGTWRFNSSDSNYVYVGDCTGTTGENIAIDAVVWRSNPLEIAEYRNPKHHSIEVYPNPFNSTCKISVLNPSEPIYIFNILGKLINRIETKQIKHFQAIWDAKDKDGNRLPTGIYLIKQSNCHKYVTLLK